MIPQRKEFEDKSSYSLTNSEQEPEEAIGTKTDFD